MPVSFGFRNEENERINSILKKLTSLVFIPENWHCDEFDQELKRLSLTLEDLLALSNNEMVDYLTRYNFDFDNMEAFADVLAQLCKKPGLEHLKEKTIAIYTYIQKKSNAFSFGINSKIDALRSNK